ncbi:hypothetical protein [Sphingomonas sp. 2SG]|uniref:hypothetical protein n=1 Tax=Sphingomonas sp. 2SG TaxID=2502201 RepID=UPI0010F70303|nr:hypothetical protein [Sphingomonas sp. 2SG]
MDLSKRGVDAKWSLDDHERLIDKGWNSREAKAVVDTVFDLQGGSIVARQQIESYVATFGITPTTTNLEKVRRTVCAAKAAACRKATADLSLARMSRRMGRWSARGRYAVRMGKRGHHTT